MVQAQRRGQLVAVILLDLDGFKASMTTTGTKAATSC
jgi:GGDEF domain-containing protein